MEGHDSIFSASVRREERRSSMRGDDGQLDRLSRRALLGVVGFGSVTIAGVLAPLIAGANGNETPEATIAEPSRSAITAPIGSETAFVARATDADRDLAGAEWYVDGEFVTAGALRGTSDTDALTWSFDDAGKHVVEALAYDAQRRYSEPATWTITAERAMFQNRAMYVWEEAARLVTDAAAADRLFEWGENGPETLFLSWGAIVDISPEALASFLRAAHEHDILVCGLVGAFDTEGIDAARRVSAAIVAYNAGRPDAERFDGIHLDVEPDRNAPGPFLDAYHAALADAPEIGAAGESVASQELSLSAAVGWWWASADRAPERTRRLVEHDALDYVVVMAYGDTTPEIRRYLSMVVADTSALYVLAVEPRTVADSARIPARSETGRLPKVERTVAAVERNPPSPGYLGAALHHYGSLLNR